MDLLIFAASVGLAANRRTPVPATGKGIPVRIFENNQKDTDRTVNEVSVIVSGDQHPRITLWGNPPASPRA